MEVIAKEARNLGMGYVLEGWMSWGRQQTKWEGKYYIRKDTVVRWGQGGETEEGEQATRIKYV